MYMYVPDNDFWNLKIMASTYNVDSLPVQLRGPLADVDRLYCSNI
jgi:hypothetical protein